MARVAKSKLTSTRVRHGVKVPLKKHSKKRYLGLELAGAKNQKTTLSVLEYFPKERKIFLVDTIHQIGGDEELLGQIRRNAKPAAAMGVSVPLELPPCLSCDQTTCPRPGGCRSAAARWMRRWSRKAARGNPHVKESTPYTQRPVELWVRYGVLPTLAEKFHFDVDETLGGNRAPLTARMVFLKKYLSEIPLYEVWPKLTLAVMASELGLKGRHLEGYRKLEQGAHVRLVILEAIMDHAEVFIYERDLRLLAQSLNSFDSFICAFTAFLADEGRCVSPPEDFPVQTGWVQYPEAGAVPVFSD